LINVALSRAREQLVVLADVKHLGASLHESSVARKVMRRIERDGAAVDAASLLGLGEVSRLGYGRHGGGPLEPLLSAGVDPVLIWSTRLPKQLDGQLVDALELASARNQPVYLRTEPPPAGEGRVTQQLQELGVSIRFLDRVVENVIVSGNQVVASPYPVLQVAPHQAWVRTRSQSLATGLGRQLKRPNDPHFADGQSDSTCSQGHPLVLRRGKDAAYLDWSCQMCPASTRRTR
jgi:hypothetical protein